MASSFLPGLTPGYFLQQSRFNNGGGIDPSQYDPSNVIDPYQAIAAQQAYAKLVFQMQNPRMALPQQFGQALGGAIQGMLPASMQAPVSQPQQSQGGPQTPPGQAIHQKYLELKQQGVDAGAALYQAADAGEDPQFGEIGGRAANQARKYAIDTLKYDPNKERDLKTESKYKSGENLVLPNGTKVMAQPGTPEYQAYMKAGAVKAAETPSLTPGALEHWEKGGMNAYGQVGPQGQPVDLKRPGVTSSAPVQYAATLSGDTAAAAWPGGSQLLTNAAHDSAIKDLGNRSASTKNALDALDSLGEALSRSPNSVGKAGDYLEGFNNIASTVQSLSNVAVGERNYTMSPGTAKKMAGLVDRTRNAGVDATKWNALITDAAYAIEATQGNTNTDPASRKSRIDQIKDDILADRSSDPRAILSVIEQQKNTLRSKLKNDFANTGGNIPPPPWLSASPQQGAASSVGGPMAGWDEAKKARYLAWKAKHPNGT